MKFKTDRIKNYQPAKLYVRIMQVASMLPLVYIFGITGYTNLITRKTAVSFIFDLGISAIPRYWALLLSLIYKKSGNEVIVCFVMLIAALIFGITADKLLASDKTAFIAKLVFAAVITADLILRLIPLQFNICFGIFPAVLGFLIRAACLALVIYDIIKNKAKKEAVTD